MRRQVQARKLSFRHLGWLLCVLGSGWPAAVWSQELDLDPFHLAPGAYDLLGLRAARLGEPGWQLGLSTQYVNDLLVVRSEGGDTVARPLQDRLVLEPSLGWSIAHRFSIGVAWPLIPYQLSSAASANARSESEAGVQDLRLFARMPLLFPDGDQGGPSLALALEGTLPTHSSGAAWLGDEGPSVTPLLLFDVRSATGLMAAFNLGYRIRGETRWLDVNFGNELRFGAGLELPLGLYGLSWLGELHGRIGWSEAAREAGPLVEGVPLEVLFAARWRGACGLRTTLGVGYGINQGYGSPDFRALVGLTFAPQASTARPIDGEEDEVELRDLEPLTAPAPAPPAATPPPVEPPPPAGPPSPADFDRWAAADPDPDGDGVPLGRDRCPAEPEDPDGHEDADGCPDLDHDHDGIPDLQDRCPTEPEVINGVEDEDGCPDAGRAQVTVTADKVEISEMIFFATASDQILGVSHNLLQQVAATLKAHPAITRLRVEGHTDAQGDAEKNMDLSVRRAQRVVEFLVKAGVEDERLTWAGYGPTRPVDQNTSEAGRARNRRVEFHIVQAPAAAGGQP